MLLGGPEFETESCKRRPFKRLLGDGRILVRVAWHTGYLSRCEAGSQP